MKWVDFFNLFTIRQIGSFFLRVRGNPTTMSLLIYSHFQVGTPIFWIPPPLFICLTLTCWQYWHLDRNSIMSLFKRSHEYASLRSRFISVAPRWIEYQEPWDFANTFFLKSSTSGTHNLPRYLSIPTSLNFLSIVFFKSINIGSRCCLDYIKTTKYDSKVLSTIKSPFRESFNR